MADNRRKAEWAIEGEKNGKRLKLVLIRKKAVDEAAVGTVATTSSYKGHRRARILNLPNAAAQPPPPASLRRVGLLGTLLRMRVPGPRCVFQKQLTKSDIDGGQSRPQLCREEVRKSVLYRLLTPEEKAAVEGGSGVKVRVLDRAGREHGMTFLFYRLLTPEEKATVEGGSGVKVRVLDRAGREHGMTFLFYPRSVKQYRFIGPDYGKLVRENRWKAGEALHLWGFRLGGNGNGVNADGQGELVVAMLNNGEEVVEEEDEEEEKNTDVGSHEVMSDHDQELHCSALTPEEMEVVGILAQMREAVLKGN